MRSPSVPADCHGAGGARRHGAGGARRLGDAGTVLGAALLAVAAVVARRPDAVTHPALWAEDGMYWFAGAYNRGPWAPLLHAHTGYLQTYSRLVADLGLLMPVRQVPALFAAAAIAVQVLPVVLLVSRRFEYAIPNRWARLAAAGVYLAVPNSFEVDANLTNAQWHLALLALLCLLAAPANRWWRALDLGAVVLSGLSGPFPVVLAVVGGAWVWRGPRHRWQVTLWGLTLGLAVVQGLELLMTPRTTGLAPLGPTVARLVAAVGRQVGLAGAIGMHGAASVTGHAHAFGAETIGFAALLAVWGATLAWGPPALRVATLYGGAVLAASLASPVTTPPSPRWQVLITADGARYWLIPLIVYLWDALWLAATAIAVVARRRGDSAGPVSGRRVRRSARTGTLGWAVSRGAAGLLGAAVIGTAAVVGMPADWSYPGLPPVHDGQAVATLQRARPGTPVTFPIEPPGWKMVLIKH